LISDSFRHYFELTWLKRNYLMTSVICSIVLVIMLFIPNLFGNSLTSKVLDAAFFTGYLGMTTFVSRRNFVGKLILGIELCFISIVLYVSSFYIEPHLSFSAG